MNVALWHTAKEALPVEYRAIERLSLRSVRDRAAVRLPRILQPQEMKQELLMISGITKKNRHEVTADINDTISAPGGRIVDHTLLSNIAITIQFTTPSQRPEEFRRRVIAVGVGLDDDSLARIRGTIEKRMSGSAGITASLNFTFIHDDPDLRRKIPAVPG